MVLSFSTKVTLIVVLSLAVGIAIYATISVTYQRNRMTQELINEKKSLNEMMAFSVESAEVHVWTWPYLVRKAAEPEDILYCRIVKSTGEIYLSNIEEERGMFINDPAIATNETVVKYDVFNGERIVVVVSPTYKDYTLWLGFSLERVYADINRLTLSALIIILGVIAACTPVFYIAVSRLLAPVKKLTSLCGDISEGNFNVRSNIQSKDEIGTLSRTFDDMTGKLEKMREEIRLSAEERFRNLYESIPDRVAVYVGREGRLIEYNESFKKWLGYTDEELKDKTFLDFVHPDDQAMVLEKYRTKYPEEELPLVYEIRAVNKKGEIRPFEISVGTYKKKGRVIGIEVLHRDITERKAMERKLQEYAEHLEDMVEKRTRELKKSEAKLKDLFKTIPDSIAIVDLNGNLLEFNETTLKLFGYPREEIIGKNVFDFVAEEDLERTARGFKQTLEKGFVRIQFLVLAKDGRKIPVELNASVLKDLKGNLVGFVAVLRDITERKRMEEQLLKSERLAAIGELATMVGHDLRNPLSSIQNACYYVKMKFGASKNEKLKKMFEVVGREINHANKIINDLLDFSRVKKPELKKVDIISSIRDALTQLESPENTTITTKYSEVPSIEADPDQLRRIFQNIALNGVQAMPDGGKLTVSTRKNGDFVEVAFTDTGVGIPEENMGKLFTPLFTTKAQGVGLGLAICKNLVEVHNGRIDVKSKVGQGSTFTVKLPIHQTEGGEKQT